MGQLIMPLTLRLLLLYLNCLRHWTMLVNWFGVMNLLHSMLFLSSTGSGVATQQQLFHRELSLSSSGIDGPGNHGQGLNTKQKQMLLHWGRLRMRVPQEPYFLTHSDSALQGEVLKMMGSIGAAELRASWEAIRDNATARAGGRGWLQTSPSNRCKAT